MAAGSSVVLGVVAAAGTAPRAAPANNIAATIAADDDNCIDRLSKCRIDKLQNETDKQ
jgi:hypothetical protein